MFVIHDADHGEMNVTLELQMVAPVSVCTCIHVCAYVTDLHLAIHGHEYVCCKWSHRYLCIPICMYVHI